MYSLNLKVRDFYRHAFLFSLAENGVMLSDGHQSDVFVVYDVLRIFKMAVSTQEVVDRRRL